MSVEFAPLPSERIVASYTSESQEMRNRRTIGLGLTDHSVTDDFDLPYENRVAHFTQIRDTMHPDTIRTEFRMRDLIARESKDSGSFICNEEVASAYVDTLKAMKEAGIRNVALALFTPEKWMQKLVESDPQKFFSIYKGYLANVFELCDQAKVAPAILQVMQEVNWSVQTDMGLSHVVEMIKVTKQMAEDSPIAKDAKIMTTFQINAIPFDDERRSWTDKAWDAILKKTAPQLTHWQRDIQKVVEEAGDALDIIGIDFYPGSYDRPGFSIPHKPDFSQSNSFTALKEQLRMKKKDFRTIRTLMKDARKELFRLSISQPDLSKSHPFQSFSNVLPYRWVFDQINTNELYKGKQVIIAETGIPTMTSDSRWGQLGMARAVSSLDLLDIEYRKDHEGEGSECKTVDEVWPFMGLDTPDIKAKTPRFGTSKFAIDATPWALFRKKEDDSIDLTQPAKRFMNMWNKLFRPNEKFPQIRI